MSARHLTAQISSSSVCLDLSTTKKNSSTKTKDCNLFWGEKKKLCKIGPGWIRARASFSRDSKTITSSGEYVMNLNYSLWLEMCFFPNKSCVTFLNGDKRYKVTVCGHSQSSSRTAGSRQRQRGCFKCKSRPVQWLAGWARCDKSKASPSLWTERVPLTNHGCIPKTMVMAIFCDPMPSIKVSASIIRVNRMES